MTQEDEAAEDTKDKASPKQIHNNFTQKIFSDEKHALSFIKMYLPSDITAQLSIADIQIIPDSFVDKHFRKHIADIIIQIKHGKEYIYVYSIIEVKSTSDKLTAAQLMLYVLKAMLKYAADEGDKPLPMIYPLILYHGKTKFNHALDFLDLVNGSKDDIDKYLRGQLQLIDLSTLSDEALMDIPHVLLALPLLCLKHIRDKNMLNFLTRGQNAKRLLRLFRQYIETAGMDNMVSVLHYIYTAGRINDEDNAEFVQFLNDVEPKLEENTMTLREAAVREGFKKGIDRGISQGFKQGIDQGISQGIDQGISQGEENATIRFIQKMLSEKPPKEVAAFFNWPLEKVLIIQQRDEL